jgi:SET domain-containing protein
MYEVKNIKKGHLGLFATEPIKKGTVILWLSKDSNYFKEPTRTSIQVRNLHLEHYEGGCTNHNCNPNAKVLSIMWGLDMNAYYIPFAAFAKNSKLNPVLMASEDILAGEEITFDYEITEEELAEPFKCNCHGRWIRGKST